MPGLNYTPRAEDVVAKAPRRRKVEKIEQAGWEVHERAFSRLYGKK